MVHRIRAVRRLRRLPAEVARMATIGVGVLLPVAIAIGAVAK